MDSDKKARLIEVANVFLWQGLTAFGGPAAHVALFHDQVVKRRKWVSDEEFLDLIGTTQIIPGPNSSELAFYLSYKQAGWLGLIVGGVSWILPSLAMIIALAWGYTRYGALPQVEWVLYAVKPVVIAIILKALIFLGKKAVKDMWTGLLTAAVIALNLLGVENALLLFGAGIVLVLIRGFGRDGLDQKAALLAAPLSLPGISAAASVSFTLARMFFTFLKIGSLLFGSGYVLLAFLNAEFVEGLGWLTLQQTIDGVAAGQVTPGPLSSTASFLGFVLGGLPGALLAELGIYLPSFTLVALTWPIIPKLREKQWLGHFLDGVNAASLGLMAVVTWQLASASLVDLPAIGLGLVSAFLVFFTDVNTTFIVLGAVLFGLGRYLLSG